MNIEQIRELVKLLEDSTLNFMEVTEGDLSICLEKNSRQEIVSVPQMAAAPTAAPAAQPAQAPAEAAAQTVSRGTAVKAPMVGVFYTAPSPDEPPYVSVGDSVKKGQVLCIIEAMKLMNEIVAEKDGVITEICLENGEVVEYGQPMFYVQ